MGPKILEKLQIRNVEGMIFGGGAHAVGEAKCPCHQLPRGTPPPAGWLPLISLKHGDGELLKLGRVFPFFKNGPILSQDQEIRGMPWRGFAPGAGVVMELDAGRLIVIFQHILITLHGVTPPELDMLAFKLDGEPHFLAGIASTHV